MTSFAAPRISCKNLETSADDVARIFNIQRYSLNDGQGIRTVVFLKAARIPVRGAPIQSLFRHASKRCGGRVNVCTARPACVMWMSALPGRLNVSGAILRWMNWNAR